MADQIEIIARFFSEDWSKSPMSGGLTADDYMGFGGAHKKAEELLALLTAAENARKAEPVAKQWRALEDGHPKTSWKSPELGDLAGWEIWAAGSGGRTVIEYRDLYSIPPQQDDLRKAAVEECAKVADKRAKDLRNGDNSRFTAGHIAMEIRALATRSASAVREEECL
jgi:hypothetical protein